MTEREWHECCDPRLLLSHVIGRASSRKLRLFACGLVSEIDSAHFDDRCRQSMAVYEQAADGDVEGQTAVELLAEAREIAGYLTEELILRTAQTEPFRAGSIHHPHGP